MRKIKIIAAVTIAALCLTLCFVGCKKTDKITDGESTAESVKLDVDYAVAAKGKSFTLTATVTKSGTAAKSGESAADGATEGTTQDLKVEWSSDDETIVTVTEGGVCNAVKCGETTVKAKAGGKEAECKITVADLVVEQPAPSAAGESAATAGEGTSGAEQGGAEQGGGAEQQQPVYKAFADADKTFATIATAITAATEGQTVAVMPGAYGEVLTVNKSISLIGVGAPSLTSLSFNKESGTISLKGLDFKGTAYPVTGEATLLIGQKATATVTECQFTITTEEQLAGGYAILADKESVKLDIQKNTIQNYRYGIYVQPTPGDVKIKENTLSNLKIGIGIDIRQPNATPAANYPTKGEITENKFNETETKTQFLYIGETYDGDFDFADHESAQEGGEGTGGESANQGLLE